MSNDQITTENHDTQSSHTPSHHDDDSYDSSLDSQNGLIEQLSSSLGLQDEEFSTSADGNIPSILADLSRAQDLANSIDSRLDGILSQLGEISAELEQNHSVQNSETSEESQHTSKPTS